MRRRPNSHSPISLFPFLDTLVCTMGSLILMLLAVMPKIRERAEARQLERAADAISVASAEPPVADADLGDPAAIPDAAPPAGPDPEELERQRAQRQLRREAWQKALADSRAELADKTEQLRKLQHRVKEARTWVEEANDQVLKAQLQGQSAEQTRRALSEAEARLRKEETQLAQRIAETRRQIDLANRRQASGANEYALIPYDGASGTVRRPIYVECSAKGFRFVAENENLSLQDMAGFTNTFNPLLSGTQALFRYWAQRRRRSRGSEPEPYVLLLVRPGGIAAYYLARSRLSALGANFGYELVDEDFRISAPESDQVARSTLRDAIEMTLDAREKLSKALARRRNDWRNDTGFDEGDDILIGGPTGPGGGRPRSIRLGPPSRPFRDSPQIALDDSGSDLAPRGGSTPGPQATGSARGANSANEGGPGTGDGLGSGSGTGKGSGTGAGDKTASVATPGRAAGPPGTGGRGTAAKPAGLSGRPRSADEGGGGTGAEDEPGGTGIAGNARSSGHARNGGSRSVVGDLGANLGTGTGSGSGPGTGTVFSGQPGDTASDASGDNMPSDSSGTSELRGGSSTRRGGRGPGNTGGTAARPATLGGAGLGSGEVGGSGDPGADDDQPPMLLPKDTLGPVLGGSDSSGGGRGGLSSIPRPIAVGDGGDDPLGEAGGADEPVSGAVGGSSRGRAPRGSARRGSTSPRSTSAGGDPASAGSDGDGADSMSSGDAGPSSPLAGSGESGDPSGASPPSLPLPMGGPGLNLRLGKAGQKRSPAKDDDDSGPRVPDEEGKSGGPLGRSRGPRLWGQARPKATIGFEKPIEIRILADRILVGSRDAVVYVGNGETVKEMVDRVVVRIEQRAEGWGDPPEGYYWSPRVKFVVYPGGNQYYEPLQHALEGDWGIPSTVDYAVEKKRAGKNATNKDAAGQQLNGQTGGAKK